MLTRKAYEHVFGALVDSKPLAFLVRLGGNS